MKTRNLWLVLPALVISGCSGGTSVDGDALARDVQEAVSDSYGGDNPYLSAVVSYSGRDAPRVTAVTSLADKDENREEAMGICRTVASVSITVDELTGVYVTAGDGGPILAECDAA